MTIDASIPSGRLLSYLKARGWTLVEGTAADRLYVMAHPEFDRRQIVFPMDMDAPDYEEMVERAARKLAELGMGRDPQSVLQSIWEAADDAASLRIVSPRHNEPSLPLTFAQAALMGVQKMLLSCACTVIAPKRHHPRLTGIDAQRFLDSVQFRHTRPGSFVINPSCPVHAMDLQTSLLPDENESPFVRRVTNTMAGNLRELVKAIESDRIEDLLDRTLKSPAPALSSNFCEALDLLKDDLIKNSVEFEFTWASSIPRPPDQPPVTTVRVQHDYFLRIGEVARALLPKESHRDGPFIGTVEKLAGAMGDEGRSGEVVLSLLLHESEQVNARATLNAEQYAKAIRAHETPGTYVRLEGRLQPGRQPRNVTEIRSFDLVAAAGGVAV